MKVYSEKKSNIYLTFTVFGAILSYALALRKGTKYIPKIVIVIIDQAFEVLIILLPSYFPIFHYIFPKAVVPGKLNLHPWNLNPLL